MIIIINNNNNNNNLLQVVWPHFKLMYMQCIVESEVEP